MDPDSMNKALDLTERLANKLGATAETLWPQIVDSVQIKALVAAIGAGCAALVLFCLLWAVYKQGAEANPAEREPYAIASFFLASAAFIATIVCLSHLPTYIAPAAAALRALGL